MAKAGKRARKAAKQRRKKAEMRARWVGTLGPCISALIWKLLDHLPG